MDFELNPEQQQVRDTFARFCDQRIAPQAAAMDEAHAFPRELFGQLAGMGLYGMRYPEDVGGSGMQLTEFCLALEEIARGSMSLAACAAMQSLMGTKFLHMLGNADILERLFKPALRGEKIGALCMTEPDSGSDLGGIATHARKVEGGYILNGQKNWVTSAPVADFFTLFAKAGAFPHALFGELAALGFFGMRYPEDVGGSGAGLLEYSLALQEIARGSMSLAACAAMQSLMGTKFLHLLATPRCSSGCSSRRCAARKSAPSA